MIYESLTRTVSRLLKLSLIFLGIYLTSTAVIIVFPQLFGMYDLPLDIIHLAIGVIKTILIFILCLTLKKHVAEGRSSGGFGVLVTVCSYFSCFILEWVSGIIYSYLLSYWISGYSSDSPIGHNISVASYIASFCSYANIFFFTAVALMLVAYGIWHTHLKLEDE